jgi:hypothetical protein
VERKKRKRNSSILASYIHSLLSKEIADKEKEVEQRNHQPDGRILINERIVLKLPLGAMTFCNEERCENYGQFQINLSPKSMSGVVLCKPHFTKWFKIMMKEEKGEEEKKE